MISQLEFGCNQHSSPKEFLDELQNKGAKIVVGFLSLYEAVDVLCTVYRHGHSIHGFLQISVLLIRYGTILNSVLKI